MLFIMMSTNEIRAIFSLLDILSRASLKQITNHKQRLSQGVNNKLYDVPQCPQRNLLKMEFKLLSKKGFP